MNNATQLLSMQYFFLEIALCSNLDITGSGYGNCGDKWTLYSNPDASKLDYNVYDSATAAADTDPTHYIDLMSSQGRALLASKTNQMTTNQLGKTYKYAIASWMRPIKVSAQISINASLQFCTKAYVLPPAFEPSFENTCPPQLGVAYANNGGSFSQILTPFVASPGNWSFLLVRTYITIENNTTKQLLITLTICFDLSFLFLLFSTLIRLSIPTISLGRILGTWVPTITLTRLTLIAKAMA
jgi:hypothetical protein